MLASRSVASADELCEAFLRAAGAELRRDNDLASMLVAAIEVAEAAWPKLKADRVAFAAFLGHRIPADVDTANALRQRALTDLYIAHACLAGDEQAISYFEERYLKELPKLLSRHRFSTDLATETTQQLRVRLFTGERPLLLAYGGTGELRGWLRTTAMRMALRARGTLRHDHDERLASAGVAAGPDLEYQRKIYQDEFRIAFAEALASLSVRERNLLKQSVLFGATTDDIAALYRVHRTTAGRWLADARARLASETRNRMVKKLGIDRRGYNSILRLIESRLDVSVARLLA